MTLYQDPGLMAIPRTWHYLDVFTIIPRVRLKYDHPMAKSSCDKTRHVVAFEHSIFPAPGILVIRRSVTDKFKKPETAPAITQLDPNFSGQLVFLEQEQPWCL